MQNLEGAAAAACLIVQALIAVELLVHGSWPRVRYACAVCCVCCMLLLLVPLHGWALKQLGGSIFLCTSALGGRERRQWPVYVYEHGCSSKRTSGCMCGHRQSTQAVCSRALWQCMYSCWHTPCLSDKMLCCMFMRHACCGVLVRAAAVQMCCRFNRRLNRRCMPPQRIAPQHCACSGTPLVGDMWRHAAGSSLQDC
jgi:hypothetical protein